MTLYPKVRNVKKASLASIIMIILSVITITVCVIVNLCTSTRYLWCLIVIAGIIYAWITAMYSIHRNVNIGSSVTLQFIIISILTIVIDLIFDYKGWAINLAIPIIIMVANVTIFVLTLVSLRRYYKYAIYQLIISVILPFVDLSTQSLISFDDSFSNTSISCISALK